MVRPLSFLGARDVHELAENRLGDSRRLTGVGAAFGIGGAMRRMRLLATALLALVLVAGALAGCSAGSASLNGTSWKLTGWTVSSLDPSKFEIIATFDDGRISGRSGVNSYNGPVKTDASGSFSAGQLATTLMAGSPEAMRAESAYLKLLAAAKSYLVSGDKLTLLDGNGNESLIFTRAGQ